MRGLKRMLQREELRLRTIIEQIKIRREDVPEGVLRVLCNDETVQYYQVIAGVTNRNGKYISKDKLELVRRLAQKTYDMRVLRVAERRLTQIQKLLKEYNDEEIENIYNKESKERQKLIKPVEVTWNQQLEAWKNLKYEGKGFDEGTTIIMTEKGERVRSKSEKIIADYLYRNNIPYHYEKPINLKGYGVVFPDFTMLSPKTGKEIYWEHEGRMTDPQYVQSAVRKISTYRKNGIFSGENLILTFETDTWALNTKEIEILAKKYLM